MKKSLMVSAVARTLQCLFAIVTLTQYGACLQVGLQQQATPADTTSVMVIQQQQQQQQQTLINNNNTPEQQQQSHQTSQTAKQPSAKSNHRLVSKLKDARHRRRHRHHRHRHYHHLGDRSAALVMVEPQHGGSSTTLTALESIVEEVARAGQLPASSSQQQQSIQQQQAHHQQLQPQPQVSAVTSGADLLLDGSSSPITHLQQAPSQQQQSQAPVPPSSHQPPPVPTMTRLPSHNSRGFFLTSMLSKIMNVLNVTEFALEMRDGISSRASCMACNAVVGLFLSPLYSKDVFSAAIRTVCTSFKIQSARVCAGLVESFQDDFEYIRKNTKLTRDEVCAVVFGVDCARRQTYNLFWTVPIPDFPTKPLESKNNNNGLSIPMNEQAMTNMEDAPDLFEYRKSNAVTLQSSGSGISSSGAISSNKNKQDKQQLLLSTARPPHGQSAGEPSDMLGALSGSSNSPHVKAGGGAESAPQSASMISAGKSGKMMKRPQYIFDDEHSTMTDNVDGSATNERQNKISSFVHITDIHIDPYYEAGSLNDCNEPLCCRATSGPIPVGDKRRQAGAWGDYGNCDTPVRTLRSALNRIRERHSNAEYWLWTGDISPHDIWNISKSEAANHVRLVSKMVRDYSNGLPVFPVIGNHEAHPVNSFSPPEISGKFSMSWLYDLLADEWSEWLPKDALKTLRVGGFYKLQVRKGFRIIALNTNYCARLNPWSFYDPVDPANQLKWLVDELLEAELNQDKVHIIGHVPPDNRECTQAWLFNFINIVDRFKDTIVAQFYGHTHRDEWRLIYSMKRNDEPIGIQYIGPSLTPFTENNPAYRIYHQDKSGHLIDSETYYFNLTEANESPSKEPNWRFSYSARTHLNMTQGLVPNEWHQYLQKLNEDDELFDSFFKNYYRSSDVKTGQVCKSKCRYQMLSDLRLSHPYKTKPKPFLANRKTSNHHRDRHDHHHHHHKRLRHSE